MQREWLRVVAVVVVGIICGWGGYWLGHLAGWSADADWPVQIGGGAGAIVLSIALAVAGALLQVGDGVLRREEPPHRGLPAGHPEKQLQDPAGEDRDHRRQVR